MDPKVYKTKTWANLWSKSNGTCLQVTVLITLDGNKLVDYDCHSLQINFSPYDHMITTRSGSSLEKHAGTFDSILSPGGSRWPSHGNSVRSNSNMGVKCLHRSRRFPRFCFVVFAHILPSLFLNWIDLQVIPKKTGHPVRGWKLKPVAFENWLIDFHSDWLDPTWCTQTSKTSSGSIAGLHNACAGWHGGSVSADGDVKWEE